MKRYFIPITAVLVVLAFISLLYSVTKGVQPDQEAITRHKLKEEFRQRTGCTIESRFEFEGHKYLRFSFGTSHGGSVVHDPNCPCFKEKK